MTYLNSCISQVTLHFCLVSSQAKSQDITFKHIALKVSDGDFLVSLKLSLCLFQSYFNLCALSVCVMPFSLLSDLWSLSPFDEGNEHSFHQKNSFTSICLYVALQVFSLRFYYLHIVFVLHKTILVVFIIFSHWKCYTHAFWLRVLLSRRPLVFNCMGHACCFIMLIGCTVCHRSFLDLQYSFRTDLVIIQFHLYSWQCKPWGSVTASL